MLEGRAAILQAASRVAASRVREDAFAVDKEARWPEAALRELCRVGLSGLVIRKDHGGLGEGLETLALVTETLGRECASTALCFGMHHVAAAVLDAKATDAQLEAHVRPVVEGKHIMGLALSEPGVGSHFWLPETRMVEASGGFRLSGVKTFTTNGGHADAYVVSAQDVGPYAAPGTFSCALIANEGEGIEWGEPWKGLGMRGNSARTLHLDNHYVAFGERLGLAGDEMWYVFKVVAPYFLIAMSGTYLGVARRALDEAVNHMKERRYSHTGETLAQTDILQHRIGSVWSGYAATRQLVLWAARQAESDSPDALAALCAAKAEVARCAVDTVNECMTLVGGRAYRDGTTIERLLRDARAAHVMSPTTDILYTWAGRALLDEPLLGR